MSIFRRSASLYFIGGIDTDIGKTLATGLIARYLLHKKVNVCTFKLAQTGTVSSVSDDILIHRQLMGIEPFAQDIAGETCPFQFALPASPHLAAMHENREIEPSKIDDALNRLQKEFEVILLEGVGGLHVPLRRNFLSVDFLQSLNAPLILVTSGKLGSINHTLQALEIVEYRGIPLAGLVFNHFHETLSEIRCNTLQLFRDKMKTLGRPDAVVEIPAFDVDNPPTINFSALIE
jgi:dethiobiotin synthetase